MNEQEKYVLSGGNGEDRGAAYLRAQHKCVDSAKMHDELVALFARALHSIDLEQEGIETPTAEQLEGWKDKYLGRFELRPTIEQVVKANKFRARVGHMVHATVHIFQKNF